MTDPSSTLNGRKSSSGEQAWDDRASIMPATQDTQLSGGGILLPRGTFAEMIHHMAQLPEEDRPGYVIAKADDRNYDADEAMKLASRPDFPPEGGG